MVKDKLQEFKIRSWVVCKRQLLCNACGGSGQTIDSKPSNADAHGMISSEETVSIKIPAGVVEGMQLKVAGKGNEAPGNGISGDLLVAIEEQPRSNTTKRR